MRSLVSSYPYHCSWVYAAVYAALDTFDWGCPFGMVRWSDLILLRFRLVMGTPV